MTESERITDEELAEWEAGHAPDLTSWHTIAKRLIAEVRALRAKLAEDDVTRERVKRNYRATIEEQRQEIERLKAFSPDPVVQDFRGMA